MSQVSDKSPAKSFLLSVLFYPYATTLAMSASPPPPAPAPPLTSLILTSISGCHVIPSFITTEEEERLLTCLKKGSWVDPKVAEDYMYAPSAAASNPTTDIESSR